MPTLRIVFTGICALTPGCPSSSSTTVSELTAVIPHAPRGRLASDSETHIAAHLPFVSVPADSIDTSGRQPDYELSNGNAIVFLDREELTLSPTPSGNVSYNVGTSPLGTAPTTSDENDARWIADFREVDPSHASLRAATLGTSSPIDPHVGARVRITSGVVSGRFPCPEKPKTTFVNTSATVSRFMAQEVAVDVPFASTVTQVALTSSRFDTTLPAAGDLVLNFPTSGALEVMVASGALDAMLNLPNGCAGHYHTGDKDYEFELFYDVLDFPTNVPLPVPRIDFEELRHSDCFAIFVD